MVGFELACCRGVPAPSSVVGSVDGKAGSEALLLTETAAMCRVQTLIRQCGNSGSTISNSQVLAQRHPRPERTNAEPDAKQDQRDERESPGLHVLGRVDVAEDGRKRDLLAE
jgi:hypothetical protein